ncbi:hypothetical protein KU710_22860, partial [Salmonella enterica subsp. enterica serovar Give]|nr:hypothetical protein [Salmonella enterica subsp. enterica serovar Give]
MSYWFYGARRSPTLNSTNSVVSNLRGDYYSLKFTLSAIALTGALFSSASQADIIISGTRIIYDANKKDVSV